jgi:Fe-S cluster assembly ATP-binding protein
MGILDVDHVRLNLGGKPVLDDLSMEIWEGHVHAIIGPNGAGKSTLASTIMGLHGYGHFEGDISFEEQSLKDVPIDERARLGISLAWQEPARFEGLTVRRFISAGAKDKSLERAQEVLETVGLEPRKYLSRFVDQTLSGGERKRVELASILAMEPRLILMDEPDSGIDVEALQRIFEALKVLREQGATIMMITHSLAVLEQAEHAFLMCCGKLLDKGNVDRIGRYFHDRCIPCDHANRPTPGELQ